MLHHLEHPGRRASPCRPSPAALLRDMRVIAVSESESTAATTINTTTTISIQTSTVSILMPITRPPTGPGTAAARRVRDDALRGPHRPALVVVRVVVAEQVQCPVDQQQGDLVVVGAGVVRGVGPCDLAAHHDVADEANSRRVARLEVGVVVDRERQHVGGAGPAHVLGVEGGHLGDVDEHDGGLRRSGDALGRQHVAHQL